MKNLNDISDSIQYLREEGKFKIAILNFEDFNVELPSEGPWSHIKSNSKRLQYFFSRNLLWNIIEREDVLLYEDTGKPFLKNGPFISISHSNKYVGVAINEIENTGIDIQIETDKIDRIKGRFCHESELNFAELSKMKNEILHYIWCAKEAVFKFYGENVIFAENMIVQEFDPLNSDVLRLNFYNNEKKCTNVFELSIHKIEKYYIAYISNVINKSNEE